MNKTLELLPAVDVVDGKAVRLLQGEAGTEQSYGSPEEAVATFVAAGASWIHLVDLDAAFGRGSNYDLLAGIIKNFPSVKIELSGGIRDAFTLERAIAAGATRVNIGTAALEDPNWTAKAIAEFGDKVAVGLDVRGEVLSARGWTRDGGNLWDVVKRLDDDGCARYVVTDVTKDGTMQGPNVELLTKVCEATDRPIVASGGVATLDNLRVLRELTDLGVEGAIVGKALYAGAFTIADALEVAEG